MSEDHSRKDRREFLVKMGIGAGVVGIGTQADGFFQAKRNFSIPVNAEAPDDYFVSLMKHIRDPVNSLGS